VALAITITITRIYLKQQVTPLNTHDIQIDQSKTDFKRHLISACSLSFVFNLS